MIRDNVRVRNSSNLLASRDVPDVGVSPNIQESQISGAVEARERCNEMRRAGLEHDCGCAPQ